MVISRSSQCILLVAIGLSFCFASCKKEVDAQPLGANLGCPYANCADYFIESPDLQNCLYLPGTYWVMYDSISSTTDSIVIDSYDQGNVGNQGTTMEYHSFKTISFPSMDTACYAVMPYGIVEGFDNSLNSGTQIYDSYDDQYSWNPAATAIDTLMVSNQDYFEAVELEVIGDPNENGNDSYYYINAEYGFLKQVVFSSGALISNKVVISQNIVR